jgi:hypothetical protein
MWHLNVVDSIRRLCGAGTANLHAAWCQIDTKSFLPVRNGASRPCYSGTAVLNEISPRAHFYVSSVRLYAVLLAAQILLIPLVKGVLKFDFMYLV